MIDSLIPDLLVLGEGFHVNHPLIQQGHLIIQDKASCLPPHVLRPTRHDILIDACAAPGNKTTFASALMNNQGPFMRLRGTGQIQDVGGVR